MTDTEKQLEAICSAQASEISRLQRENESMRRRLAMMSNELTHYRVKAIVGEKKEWRESQTEGEKI